MEYIGLLIYLGAMVIGAILFYRRKAGRSPFLAAILQWPIFGLGYFYIHRGLRFLGAILLLMIGGFFIGLLGLESFYMGFVALWWIGIAVDAFYICRRSLSQEFLENISSEDSN